MWFIISSRVCPSMWLQLGEWSTSRQDGVRSPRPSTFRCGYGANATCGAPLRSVNFTYSAKGLRSVVPFRGQVPAKVLVSVFPVSSTRSLSTFTAYLSLTLNQCRLSFDLGSHSRATFVSPLETFSPLLSGMCAEFRRISSKAKCTEVRMGSYPSASVVHGTNESSKTNTLAS